jgi:hypothetical protein
MGMDSDLKPTKRVKGTPILCILIVENPQIPEYPYIKEYRRNFNLELETNLQKLTG